MRWGMSDMARGNKGQILLLALLVMFVLPRVRRMPLTTTPPIPASKMPYTG